MAVATDTLPVAHLQPSHLPPAGRTLSSGQHRRSMLASLAGIAAGAVAAPAQAAEPDPVLALITRYDALERQGAALLLVGDEDGGAMLLDAAWRAADEATATAPTTIGGLIAQLRVLGERLTEGSRQDDADAADAFAIMRHAQALAGRA